MAIGKFDALGREASDLPVIAVDLGYSAKSKTCGIASSVDDRGANCTFGDCIKRTADAIRTFGSGSAVVVLEAVLSTRHDAATGNPILRAEFERGRGWYCQSGVVTFASALRFLHQLRLTLPRGMRVCVAEAFLSNKAGPTSHATDASQIVQRFWSIKPVELSVDVEPASPQVRNVPPIRVFD